MTYVADSGTLVHGNAGFLKLLLQKAGYLQNPNNLNENINVVHVSHYKGVVDIKELFFACKKQLHIGKDVFLYK